MRTVLALAFLVTAILMFLNLVSYGWFSHSPDRLAAGIICGFSMLACLMAAK